MKRNFRLKDYLLMSIAFHVVVGLAFFLSSTLKAFKKNNAAVEVTVITPEDVKKLQQPEVTVAKEIEKKKNRLVETNNANDQKTKDAELLSEKNNAVNKQTIAKLAQEFKNVKKQGGPTSLTQKAQAESKKTNKPQLFNQPFDPYAALTKKTMEQDLKAQAKDQQKADAGDQSTATDRIEGIQSDLITTLNTREYKYYGFYHRIKLQLNQWWQPKVREKITKLMKQGRNLASETNRVTRLLIVLNNSGTLVKIQVMGASGVRDLDDAAVEAFRQAAPFPNPPKGIIDQDGTVKIPWDFVIES